MAKVIEDLGERVRNVASDLLESGDFLSRTIGMTNSYEALEYAIQTLGHEPVSLLGHDFPYIFDHVRRNYRQGTVENAYYDDSCYKFTFYKKDDLPTIRFADPYNDHLNWVGKWTPTMEFGKTGQVNGYYTYAESLDGKENMNKSVEVVNYDGTMAFKYTSFPDDTRCDLLSKTNHNFRKGRYETLIARFYTNTEESRRLDDPTQSAVSSQYGASHGRNLLKLKPDDPNGYKNPYCRVWTYHHEYLKVSDLIRPFGDEQSKDGSRGTKSFRTFPHKFYGFDDAGADRLEKLGVLNYRNGHIRIAPTAKIKNYFDGSGYDDGPRTTYSPKNCMFSIENLAWKNTDTDKSTFDAYGLSAEQKGPLGGRIMWFPPYNLKFSESVDVRWNPNDFIGRGETLYTYTNTQRNGSLSFTILIDHPSILDYLKKDASGEIARRDGRLDAPSDKEGGEDSVDDINSAEQTILRFFAGCDVLTAEPQKYHFRKAQKPNVGTEAERPGPLVKDKNAAEEKPGSHKLVCFLYYPNNYSGIDDAPVKKDAVVNAIDYLMNGIGAQKELNNAGDNAVDFFVPNTVAPKVGNTTYGGYEITTGISIATQCDTGDTKEIRPGVSLLTNNRKAGVTATYGSSEHKLCKMVSTTPNYTTSKQRANNYKWYCKWYYRVDKDHGNDKYVSDVLNHENSYLDITTYGLNQKSGYEQVKNVVGGPKLKFGYDPEDTNTKLVAFTDLYVSIIGGSVETIMAGKYDENNVSFIKDLFTNKEKYKVTKCTFRGNASRQGHVDENVALAQNRSETFCVWMGEHGIEGKTDPPNPQDALKNHPDVGNNSSLQTKLWRSAMMVVEYDMVDVEDAQTQDPGENTNTTGVSSGETTQKQVDLNVSSDDGIPTGDVKDMTLEQKLAWVKRDPYARAVLGNELMNELESTWADNPDAQTGTSTVKRYDNEGEFFKEINRTDNFLRHKIKEKIKYFDPAFHSISPEGFSSRLTFLHQCTRQSSTVSNSAWESSTAYNLAFGRPPVCVLRLGDFYYTKIVISSIQINYDDVQWDLNPEGAGVIPMFADVTINFHFIGGSDLGGPIARLQNAVSFNYYANTSVYDNRAEMVKYDESGNGKVVAFKPFTYPNTTGRKIGSGGEYGTIKSETEAVIDRNTFYNTGDVKADTYNYLDINEDGMWSDL